MTYTKTVKFSLNEKIIESKNNKIFCVAFFWIGIDQIPDVSSTAPDIMNMILESLIDCSANNQNDTLSETDSKVQKKGSFIFIHYVFIVEINCIFVHKIEL